MSITEEVYLPSDEELSSAELNVSTPILRAGAMHLGKSCQFENNEFMLCRQETGDPRACIKEGKAVTACAIRFFQEVKSTCYGEFMQYVNCLDKSSPNSDFGPCRRTQEVFDKCMKDNLNMERAPYDEFVRVQVHKTLRPKPEPEPKVEYDTIPYLPEGAEMPPAKYGSRYLFSW